jgi:hypothetical protein
MGIEDPPPFIFYGEVTNIPRLVRDLEVAGGRALV